VDAVERGGNGFETISTETSGTDDDGDQRRTWRRRMQMPPGFLVAEAKGAGGKRAAEARSKTRSRRRAHGAGELVDQWGA
jgi:hypothetical protein